MRVKFELEDLREWKIKQDHGDREKIALLVLKKLPLMAEEAARKRVYRAFKYGYCNDVIYAVIKKFYSKKKAKV